MDWISRDFSVVVLCDLFQFPTVCNSIAWFLICFGVLKGLANGTIGFGFLLVSFVISQNDSSCFVHQLGFWHSLAAFG